jgi:hypothetical protein
VSASLSPCNMASDFLTWRLRCRRVFHPVPGFVVKLHQSEVQQGMKVKRRAGEGIVEITSNGSFHLELECSPQP